MPGLVHPRIEVVNSGGTIVKEVIYPNPVTVHFIHAAHDTGVAGWIQVFNSATVPAEGSTPLLVHGVSANGDADIEVTKPLYFSEGVYVCESSTMVTKTLAAVAHLFVHMYVEVGEHTH